MTLAPIMLGLFLKACLFTTLLLSVNGDCQQVESLKKRMAIPLTTRTARLSGNQGSITADLQNFNERDSSRFEFRIIFYECDDDVQKTFTSIMGIHNFCSQSSPCYYFLSTDGVRSGSKPPSQQTRGSTRFSSGRDTRLFSFIGGKAIDLAKFEVNNDKLYLIGKGGQVLYDHSARDWSLFPYCDFAGNNMSTITAIYTEKKCRSVRIKDKRRQPSSSRYRNYHRHRPQPWSGQWSNFRGNQWRNPWDQRWGYQRVSYQRGYRRAPQQTRHQQRCDNRRFDVSAYITSNRRSIRATRNKDPSFSRLQSVFQIVKFRWFSGFERGGRFAEGTAFVFRWPRTEDYMQVDVNDITGEPRLTRNWRSSNGVTVRYQEPRVVSWRGRGNKIRPSDVRDQKFHDERFFVIEPRGNGYMRLKFAMDTRYYLAMLRTDDNRFRLVVTQFRRDLRDDIKFDLRVTTPPTRQPRRPPKVP